MRRSWWVPVAVFAHVFLYYWYIYIYTKKICLLYIQLHSREKISKSADLSHRPNWFVPHIGLKMWINRSRKVRWHLHKTWAEYVLNLCRFVPSFIWDDSTQAVREDSGLSIFSCGSVCKFATHNPNLRFLRFFLVIRSTKT